MNFNTTQMNYISVCRTGKKLTIYCTQPPTTSTTVLCLLKVRVWRSSHWCWLRRKSSGIRHRVVPHVVTTFRKISFPPRSRQTSWTSWTLKTKAAGSSNFPNSMPVYKLHIPEALRFHSSNSCLRYTQKQAIFPDFTFFSSKHDTFSPTYLCQKDERKMPDNIKRRKIIFYCNKYRVSHYVPLLFLSEYSLHSSRFKELNWRPTEKKCFISRSCRFLRLCSVGGK